MTLAMAIEPCLGPPPLTLPVDAGPASAELFVGLGDYPERYQWSNVLSAYGSFLFTCLPNALVVETMSELRPEDRPRMKHAVDGSFVAAIVVYVLSGVPLVARWGGDLPNPITSVFENNFTGIVVKAGVIYGAIPPPSNPDCRAGDCTPGRALGCASPPHHWPCRSKRRTLPSAASSPLDRHHATSAPSFAPTPADGGSCVQGPSWGWSFRRSRSTNTYAGGTRTPIAQIRMVPLLLCT